MKYQSGLSKNNYTVEPIETKAALNIVIENHYLHRAAPCSKAYGIFAVSYTHLRAHET